jgi:hypothetical protein
MNGIALLGPNARPMVGLGGSEAWKQRTIGGITCSFQWIDLSARGLEAANACMCLFNANRGMKPGSYVIPQQNAWQFGDKAGHPTTHLFSSAFALAEQLGFDMRDKSAIRKAIDIIIEGLPDLILMPSEPPNAPEVIVREAIRGIEATARVNGRVVHQEVL